MPRTALRLVLALVIGAVAGSLVHVAVRDFLPSSDWHPWFLLGGAALAALWYALAGRSPERLRKEWIRVGGAFVFALVVVCVARPFRMPDVRWVMAGNHEAGRRLPYFHYPINEWGDPHWHVASFHATDVPQDKTQPFRHRIEGNVRYLTRGGPATLSFHVTQPRNALIDAETGEIRAGVDGVTGVIECLGDSGWVPRAGVDLEPTATSWRSFSVEIPQGTKAVALQWLARGNRNCDAVLVDFAAPTATQAGLPLALVQKPGELIVFALAALLASFVLQAFLYLLGRASRVPPVVAPRPRVRLGLGHAALLLLILGLPLLVAVRIAPWLEATTTPLILHSKAPEGTPIEVVFGDAPDDHVPAIRLDDQVWRAELPPRPSYRLAFELPAASRPQDLIERIEVVDSLDHGLFAEIRGRDLRPAKDAAARSGGTGGESSPARVRLEAPSELPIGRTSRGERVLAVWLGLSVLLAVMSLALWMVARFARTDDAPAVPPRGGARVLAITGVVVAILTIVWSISAPTIVTADTVAYLRKGDTIAEKGVYDTGDQLGELTRAPGYPAFLAAVLKILGHNLTGISLAQGLLYAFALFFVALSLRRMVKTGWLVAGMILSLTPPQLAYSRTIISESPCVSLSLIALGCFFFSRTAARPKDLYWLVAFAIVTFAAVCTRLIAVALLAAPTLTWLSGSLALWRSAPDRRQRVGRVARHSLSWMLVVGIVVAGILAWSYRNYRARGFFGFAAMVSLSDLQGETFTGTIDPRILAPDGLYDDYVQDKSKSGGFWTTWFIYDDLFKKAEGERLGRKRTISRVEDLFGELYRANTANLPGMARLLPYLRCAWWNLRPRETRDYVGNIKPGIYVHWTSSETYDDPKKTADLISERATVPMAAGDFRRGAISDGVLSVSEWYRKFPFPLFVLAFVGALWAVGRGRPSLAAPFAFVLANWLLLTWLRQPEARYMDVLDVFCILQIVIVLGWRRAPAATPAVAVTTPA